MPSVSEAARQRLDAWLKGPVAHGSTVRLHASAATGTFALYADDERPSIVGRLGTTETAT